jgi:hypothetical protein
MSKWIKIGDASVLDSVFVKQMRLFSFLMGVILSGLAYCAEPVVHAQLDESEIYKGENVTLTVQVENATDDTKLDISSLASDFAVTLILGPIPSSFPQIHNGRISQKISLTWHYRLTPKKSGSFNLLGLAVVTDGKRVAAPKLKLSVKEIEPQDQVLLEVSAPPKVFRVPFDVTLRIRVRPLPDGSDRDPVEVLPATPVLTIDWLKEKDPDGLVSGDLETWLRNYLSKEGRGFSINNFKLNTGDLFEIMEGRRRSAFNLYTRREVRKGLDGKDINYYVYELKRTFTPQRSGVFKFDGVTLTGTFADRIEAGSIHGSRYVVPAAPYSVEVCDVPTPRPVNYIGGLGGLDAFAVSLSATPSTLRVGDPLTLKLVVERKTGSGPLDTVSAPDLSLMPEIANDFEVIDKMPTGEVHGDRKQFSYGLRPKRAGVTIPALKFSIFDPATEKFISLPTQPIVLHVTGSAQLHTDEIVSSMRAPVAQGLKNVEGGIFQNISDVSVLGNQQVNPYQHWIVVFGLLGVYGVVSMGVARSRRLAGDARWQRRKQAWPQASAALDHARIALKSGDRSRVASQLCLAFNGLIGNGLNAPTAGLTPVDAGRLLASAGLETGLQTRTVNLLEQIDALQYASMSSIELESLLESASLLLPELRRALEARNV